MLKLSKITDYGIVIMTVLARAPKTLRSTADLAAETHVAPPTVSKTLKLLVHGDLVKSIRGPQGGYRLARSPADIVMADIIAALEGPFGLTECAHHEGNCSIETHCSVKPHWQVLNQAILGALSQVSLADMTQPAAHIATINASAIGIVGRQPQ